jgi:hypothetical protein
MPLRKKKGTRLCIASSLAPFCRPASSVYYALPCLPPSYRHIRVVCLRLPHRTPPSHRTISAPLDTTQIALSPPGNAAHIAHAILVALVAVFLTRIGALPPVIPRRDARKKSVQNQHPSLFEICIVVNYRSSGSTFSSKRSS